MRTRMPAPDEKARGGQRRGDPGRSAALGAAGRSITVVAVRASCACEAARARLTDTTPINQTLNNRNLAPHAIAKQRRKVVDVQRDEDEDEDEDEDDEGGGEGGPKQKGRSRRELPARVRTSVGCRSGWLAHHHAPLRNFVSSSLGPTPTARAHPTHPPPSPPLLPSFQAVTILKEWLLSEEHFTHPYVTLSFIVIVSEMRRWWDGQRTRTAPDDDGQRTMAGSGRWRAADDDGLAEQ